MCSLALTTPLLFLFCHRFPTWCPIVGGRWKTDSPLPMGWWPTGKEYAYKAGEARDSGSIPGLGRGPGGGNGNPLWYSWLKNPMDRRASRLQSMGIAKSQTQLSVHTHTTACQISLTTQWMWTWKNKCVCTSFVIDISIAPIQSFSAFIEIFCNVKYIF